MSEIDKEKLNPVVGVDTSKNYCYHLVHNDNGTFTVAICYEGVNGWFNAVNYNGKGVDFDNEEKGQKFVDAQNKLLGRAVIDVTKITLSSMGF